MRNQPSAPATLPPADRGGLPKSTCPECSYTMDSATDAGGGRAEPEAGDFSICLNCGACLKFNDILVLEPIPPDELAGINDRTLRILSTASDQIKARGLLYPKP